MNHDTRQRVARELAAELLARDVELTLHATGRSMGATIRAGDRVVVRRTSIEALRPGYVVLLRRDAGFTAHRILYKRCRGSSVEFVTQGDALWMPDLPVGAGHVVGRVVAIRTAGRTVDLTSVRQRLAGKLRALVGRIAAAVARIVRPSQRRGGTART